MERRPRVRDGERYGRMGQMEAGIQRQKDEGREGHVIFDMKPILCESLDLNSAMFTIVSLLAELNYEEHTKLANKSRHL